MSAPRDPRAPLAFEIPDLELPSPRPSQSSLRAVGTGEAAPSARTEPARLDTDPAGLQLDDPLLGPSFDLELSGPISMGGHTLAHCDRELEGAPGELELAAMRAAPSFVTPDQREWPSGCSPEREHLVLDAARVATIAAYGRAPSSFLLSPLYAVRVLARRLHLREASANAEAQLAEQTQAREALLGQLTQRVRPELDQSVGFRAALAGLHQLESELGTHANETAATQARFAGELAALAAQQSACSSEDAERRRSLERSGEQLGIAEQHLRRAEARHKRIAIELRALEPRADGSATAPAAAASVASLVAEADALLPELEERRRHLVACEQSHLHAERALRETELRMTELTRRGRELEHGLAKQLRAQAPTASKVAREYARALAELGTRVLASPGSVQLEPTLLARVATLDHHVLRALQTAELQRRALLSYHRERYAQGLWLLGLAACAAIAGVLLVLV